MTPTPEFESRSLPLQTEGIHIDADSVRAELDESPESHGLSAQDAELIADLDDEQINAAIRSSADDHFWAAYDGLRGDAISQLAHELGVR